MFRFGNGGVAAINVGKYKGVDVGSNIVRVFAMGNFAGYVAISGRYFSLYVNGPLLLRLASLRDTYHRKRAYQYFFLLSRVAGSLRMHTLVSPKSPGMVLHRRDIDAGNPSYASGGDIFGGMPQ